MIVTEKAPRGNEGRNVSRCPMWWTLELTAVYLIRSAEVKGRAMAAAPPPPRHPTMRDRRPTMLAAPALPANLASPVSYRRVNGAGR